MVPTSLNGENLQRIACSKKVEKVVAGLEKINEEKKLFVFEEDTAQGVIIGSTVVSLLFKDIDCTVL